MEVRSPVTGRQPYIRGRPLPTAGSYPLEWVCTPCLSPWEDYFDRPTKNHLVHITPQPHRRSRPGGHKKCRPSQLVESDLTDSNTLVSLPPTESEVLEGRSLSSSETGVLVSGRISPPHPVLGQSLHQTGTRPFNQRDVVPHHPHPCR